MEGLLPAKGVDHRHDPRTHPASPGHMSRPRQATGEIPPRNRMGVWEKSNQRTLGCAVSRVAPFSFAESVSRETLTLLKNRSSFSKPCRKLIERRRFRKQFVYKKETVSTGFYKMSRSCDCGCRVAAQRLRLNLANALASPNFFAHFLKRVAVAVHQPEAKLRDARGQAPGRSQSMTSRSNCWPAASPGAASSSSMKSPKVAVFFLADRHLQAEQALAGARRCAPPCAG